MNLPQIHNLEAMKTLKLVEDMEPRVIFLDPPFNIGEPYEHGDSRADYYDWMYQVIEKSRNVLARDGSLWINCPDQHVATFCEFATNDWNHMELENWCIWHYRFAQCQPNRFLKSKTHVLWLSHGKPYVDTEFARVPSDRATIYNDPRINDTERGGKRMDFDVWGFEPYWGRVQGNNKERIPNSPNQLPEKYLERVIGTTSMKDDLIVDPFVGSGTTAVVSKAMGRRFIGGDLSKKACKAAERRVLDGAVRISKPKKGE